MKTRISRSIRLTAGIFFLTATLAATTSAAQSFADGTTWHVEPGDTTNPPEHDNAVYMVFHSNPPPDKQYGIFFVQTQGTYAFDPFYCTGGTWTPATQSVSCSIEGTLDGTALFLKETVEIGRLPGSFCGGLRKSHNPGPGTGPIKDEDRCHAPGKCTCYEVKHECRADAADPWEPDMCLDSADIVDGDFKETSDEKRSGRVPPSGGAGTGKTN